MEWTGLLTNLKLPEGIWARYVSGINGLMIHVLEAGYEDPDHPVILLLYGFHDLAYSRRKVMLPIAVAGYYVITTGMRCYRRATGWDKFYKTVDVFYYWIKITQFIKLIIFALNGIRFYYRLLEGFLLLITMNNSKTVKRISKIDFVNFTLW